MKRDDLYEAVWSKLRAIAEDAAPGSIEPRTFAQVAVDVVLAELRKDGSISPDYYRPTERDVWKPRE